MESSGRQSAFRASRDLQSECSEQIRLPAVVRPRLSQSPLLPALLSTILRLFLCHSHFLAHRDHAHVCHMIASCPPHHVISFRHLLSLPCIRPPSSRPCRLLHSTSYILPHSSRLSASRPLQPFGELPRPPSQPLRSPHPSETDRDGRERRMRQWRRQKQREADEIVLLPAEDDSAQHVTSNTTDSQDASVSIPSPEASKSATDPDSRYQTADDSTRASLMAFAELEGRLRAKQAIKESMQAALAVSTPTDSTTAAAATSTPTYPSPAPPTDADLMASSMDAFAALELQLAKKRLQKKQDYLDDPTTRTTEQTLTTADTQPAQLTVLTAPRMPEPQECCGMSCPNCVSYMHLPHVLGSITPLPS